jgi:hypothetical protein
MRSERQRDFLVCKILPLYAQVAGRTAIHFGRACVVLADSRFRLFARTCEPHGDELLLQDTPVRLPGSDHDEDQHTQERAACR